jgi:diacylglycerol O-acyltransferase / wax synthase
MSPMDAFMYYVDSPRTPNVITFVNLHDQSTVPGGRLTFRDVLRGVEERLHLSPAFRDKIARVPLDLDHPYWEPDPDFDLEFHVRHIALPQPGDWRQLCILVARLASRQLDLSRPPWEMWIVEGLDGVEGVPPGGFAVVLRIHHSAIDGVAGAEILTALTSTTPDDAGPPRRHEPWTVEPAPSELRRLLGAGVHLATRPTHLLGRIRPLAEAGVRLARERHPLPTFRVPKTRFNHPVSPHRVWDATAWPLDEVKSIRALAAGATVNDVVLAVVAGALRRYLELHGELPAESLVSLVPVSVRDDRRPDSVGNEIASMAVPLHTDVADAVERFRRIRSSTQQSKARKQAVGARTLTEAAAVVPGGLMGLAFRAQAGLAELTRVQTGPNTSITNVPGPTVPLYFLGARMVGSWGVAPLSDGVGLFHIASSYTGRLTLSYTADRAMMPDPAVYGECLEESFHELAAAAQAHRDREA